jgi:glutamyl/glutaminyl-tRNA synthetase
VARVCLGVLLAEGLVAEPVTPEQRAYVEKVVLLLGDRLKVGEDILTYGDFFFREVTFDPAAEQQYLRRPQARELLRALADRLEQDGVLSHAAAEAAVRALAAERGIHSREVIHPARVALTGKTAGPGLFELMELLGRPRVVARLRAAAERAG